MSLTSQHQFQRAAANYDNQCEPDPEISDKAFQHACEDVALVLAERTDDLSELLYIVAEVAPAMAYIASVIDFPPAYAFQLREFLTAAKSMREQVEEQARLMS